MEICKHERDPNEAESQLLIRGKDPLYNQSILETREMVDKVLKMAEKAIDKCAQAADAGPQETKPYDKKYYGALSSVKEFKTSHKKTTTAILKNSGGHFSKLSKTNNAFWKPKSRIFTKDFVKRFPKFAGPAP